MEKIRSRVIVSATACLMNLLKTFIIPRNRFLRTIQYFAILAIIIACLGLYGLVTFIAERKRKEVGIRKVLGAKTSTIVILFSREFSILVFIATLLACQFPGII